MAGQGQGQANEIKNLLEDYRKEIERLKSSSSKLIVCNFCGGDGKMKQANGKLFRDRYGCPVPCGVCNGKGKVRA